MTAICWPARHVLNIGVQLGVGQNQERKWNFGKWKQELNPRSIVSLRGSPKMDLGFPVGILQNQPKRGTLIKDALILETRLPG